MLQSGSRSTLWWVTFFAIAMAFLETAVVVYIRKLYYPEGFMFPMKLIAPDIALTEFLREVATLIMLAGIGIIAGRNKIEKFGYFIFTFAIWDIFYYVFLYALLKWPSSLLTWDVLFLIPCTWVGPVLAPVINSLCMIGLFFLIHYYVGKTKQCTTGPWVWALLVAGSLVVIASYIEDYLDFMLQKFSWGQIFDLSLYDQTMPYAITYVPMDFKWWLFSIGAAMHLAAMFIIWKRNLEYEPRPQHSALEGRGIIPSAVGGIVRLRLLIRLRLLKTKAHE